MNVMFLDFDGVVNTLTWCRQNADGTPRYDFYHPHDRKVNNYDAVQWVSEFCKKFDYKIVVSSSWRAHGLDVCKECLLNGGLRKEIEIIGITRRLFQPNIHRGDEISIWLTEHPDVKNYIIVDDECDVSIEKYHKEHFVQCDTYRGFGLYEYDKCKEIHKKFNPDCNIK